MQLKNDHTDGKEYYQFKVNSITKDQHLRSDE